MKINQKCVGCAQCAAYCPCNAIEVFGRAFIGEKCAGCGICINYCPMDAISEDE